MDTEYLIHPRKVPTRADLQGMELALLLAASSACINTRIFHTQKYDFDSFFMQKI